MRILYGVVGEGMGHAIRSRVVLDELVQRHEVQVVVSGRAHEYLAKRASEHLQVKKIWGFTIVTEDNEVRNFRTLLENLKGALTGGWPQNIKTYFEIADSFRPDVVISDFESWSYLYGVNHALPVISVDNMQIINRCRHDREMIAGHEASFQLAKGDHQGEGARRVPLPDHHLLPPGDPQARAPPCTRRSCARRSSRRAAEQGKHLLVYQTYTGNEQLPELLRAHRDRVPDLRPAARPARGRRRGQPALSAVQRGGLHRRPAHLPRGVIASGGFTLMGEAVYLHKPMLAEPVARQFEQILNARYLEKEGYGLCAEQMTEATARTTSSGGCPTFEENLSRYSQDGNEDLLSKLESVMEAAAKGVPAGSRGRLSGPLYCASVAMASRCTPTTLAASITSTTRPWETPASAWMITCASGESRRSFWNRSLSAPRSIALPSATTVPSLSTATGKSRACACSSLAAPLGRSTRTPVPPPCACSTTMLLPTMKMISSTRKMSVSGVMLISLKTDGPNSSSSW